MASLFGFLNTLLPFATPGTPLVQDLLHLGAICAALYFAPQFQQWCQRRGIDLQQDEPNELDQLRDLNGVPAGRADARPANGDHEPAGDVVNDAAAVRPEANEDDLGHGGQQEADGMAGPAANAARPLDPASQRTVGAKKAKSLARKDQRRAYHEFQRSQGEAQRQRDAEGAAEREAAQAAERERRRAAEAALEAKKTTERERKREQERREREEEIRRRELAVNLVEDEMDSTGFCELIRVARQVGDVDQDWVENIVKASGMIGRKENVVTMITETGWAVRVTAADMQGVYQAAMPQTGLAGADGKISYEALGGMLEKSLRYRQSA